MNDDKTALTVQVGDDHLPVAFEVMSRAQVELLSRRTPPKFILKRKGRGGKEYDYVTVNFVIGVLNAVFGFNWDIEVKDKIIDWEHDNIAMLVRLTVRFANGQTVSKEAWGGSEIKRIKGNEEQLVDLADDLKSAESDALKKAASKLGVAWDVYSGLAAEDTRDGERGEGYRAPAVRNVPPQTPPLNVAEAAKLAEEIRVALVARTIDPIDFKAWLKFKQGEDGKFYVGKYYGKDSLRAGKVADLKLLRDKLNDYIGEYIQAKMGDDSVPGDDPMLDKDADR